MPGSDSGAKVHGRAFRMNEELNQLQVFVGLIGGLALFLFGMNIMTRALKQVTGNSMKSMKAASRPSLLPALLS